MNTRAPGRIHDSRFTIVMNIAVVVQRYGADINGGAELHARYIAEGLARHADVRVLTTCARDYITWRNEMTPGRDTVNGVPVERFPVRRERDLKDFARRSTRVFTSRHSLHDELAWLDSEGPLCPRLIERLHRSGDEFDFVLLFSARYYQAYHGARALPDRAVLVPTAEREAAIALSMFGPIFRGVRAVMYNSPEEQAMITRLTGNADVPGVVVGIGSEVPADASGERAHRQSDVVRREAARRTAHRQLGWRGRNSRCFSSSVSTAPLTREPPSSQT